MADAVKDCSIVRFLRQTLRKRLAGLQGHNVIGKVSGGYLTYRIKALSSLLKGIEKKVFSFVHDQNNSHISLMIRKICKTLIDIGICNKPVIPQPHIRLIVCQIYHIENISVSVLNASAYWNVGADSINAAGFRILPILRKPVKKGRTFGRFSLCRVPLDGNRSCWKRTDRIVAGIFPGGADHSIRCLYAGLTGSCGMECKDIGHLTVESGSFQCDNTVFLCLRSRNVFHSGNVITKHYPVSSDLSFRLNSHFYFKVFFLFKEISFLIKHQGCLCCVYRISQKSKQQCHQDGSQNFFMDTAFSFEVFFVIVLLSSKKHTFCSCSSSSWLLPMI